jgi:hypothetical protein
MVNENGTVRRIGRDDVGGDNRIYLDELSALRQNYDISCILTLGGTLSAFVEVEVTALCVPGGGPCALDRSASVDFPVAEWDLPCDDPEPAILANLQGPVLTMVADTLPQVGDTYRSPAQGPIYTEGTISDVSDDGVFTLFPATSHSVLNTVPLQEPVDVADPRLSDENRISLFIRYNTANQPSDLRILRVRNQKVHYQDFPLSSLAGVNKLIVEGTVGHDTIRIDPRVTELIPSLTQITVNSGYGHDHIDFGLIDPAVSHLVSTTIDAGGGNDVVLGTFAADTLLGGPGDDQLSGEDGADEIHGGPGNDDISGGRGDDLLYGNTGADTIAGQSGNNRMFGNGGGDTIFGSDGGWRRSALSAGGRRALPGWQRLRDRRRWERHRAWRRRR